MRVELRAGRRAVLAALWWVSGVPGFGVHLPSDVGVRWCVGWDVQVPGPAVVSRC